jgi:AcrR family transcriptional regulator
VLEAAVRTFALTGYHATPVSDIAAAADISQGYVLRLFGSKRALFIATLDRTYRRIAEVLETAADGAGADTPQAVLDAMAAAYAKLIAERDYLMIQVHAQSASDEPEIRDAMQRGLERLVAVARDRSGAGDDDVQRFLAYGQLCHLVVTAGLVDLDSRWADIITHGLRHLDAPPTSR